MDHKSPLLSPEKHAPPPRVSSADDVELNIHSSPDLLPKPKSPTIQRSASQRVISPVASDAEIAKSTAAPLPSAADNAAANNFSFLDKRWTAISHNSSLLNNIRKLTRSKRADTNTSPSSRSESTEMWDTFRYGILRTPSLAFNPFIRTSLVRAAPRERTDDDDDDCDDG